MFYVLEHLNDFHLIGHFLFQKEAEMFYRPVFIATTLTTISVKENS